jgi:EmrB/QacA subfamily drug resistance transporter
VTGEHRLATRWLVLAVLCFAQLTVVLDNTVLNVAIPALTTSLGADTADIQWMINAYALVQAGLLLTAGGAADRYGRKRLLLIGLVLFGLGSLAAGLAQTSAQLIAARAGLGVGGALLVTSTLAVALQIFPPDERPRAIGIWAAVSALGFAIGPLVGGAVLEHFWWGAIFLINLPIVLVSLIAAVYLVPESRNPAGGPPDLVGAILATAAMTALVWSIISGSYLLTGGIGVLLLALFIGWESRVAHPMLNLALFRDRRFASAVTGIVMITFGSAGALFLMTQQLQLVRGYTPWEAGLGMLPFALSIVLLNFSGVSAALMRRIGLPRAIALGMGLLAAGLAVVAHFTTDGYGVLLLGLTLMGAGCALANPAIIEAVMSAIPASAAGAGAGIDATMSEIGGALGVAVLGAVMNSRFLALLPVAAASFPEALDAARTEPERSAVVEAFMAGLETGQLVGAVAILLGGLLTALLLHRADRSRPAT